MSNAQKNNVYYIVKGRGRVKLQDPDGLSYSRTQAWCTIIAKKEYLYLCSYTCPFDNKVVRKWIDEFDIHIVN